MKNNDDSDSDGTLIKVKGDTHKELKSLATYEDTMDSVVRMLLEFYKKYQKR